MTDNSNNFIDQCARVFDRTTKTYPEGHLLMLGVADGADGISLWANYTDNTSVIAMGIANAMLRDDRVREIIEQTIIAHAMLTDMKDYDNKNIFD